MILGPPKQGCEITHAQKQPLIWSG